MKCPSDPPTDEQLFSRFKFEKGTTLLQLLRSHLMRHKYSFTWQFTLIHQVSLTCRSLVADAATHLLMKCYSNVNNLPYNSASKFRTDQWGHFFQLIDKNATPFDHQLQKANSLIKHKDTVIKKAYQNIKWSPN